MRVKRMELKRLRINAGMSLRQLAAKADLSWDTVMEMESGKRTPQASSIKKLADALGVIPDSLIDWEAEQQADEVEEGKAAA